MIWVSVWRRAHHNPPSVADYGVGVFGVAKNSTPAAHAAGRDYSGVHAA
jgi:hypothetical protein